jgi:eukaryotic-like serine/threonine-protein kinase
MSELLLTPGDFFAGQKFKIVRLLGKGGMSEVWEALRTSHGGHVALKILAPQFALREDFTSRLRAESVFYSVLTHPNIVRMLDSDHEELTRRVYIVMELLKGKTLRQLLVRHGSLKWIYVLHILNQAADAMTLAHSKGILHRDLKPENLFICTDPANKGHLSVLDFGIAKWVDNRLDTGALPQMGTARYMSPEQVKSLWKEHRNITIDGRSDIYTFGAIGYEAITGRHHFIDDRCPPPVEVILNGHLTADVVPIQDLAPDCPDALAAILEKCLEKDREKRYPGMRELWDDLNSFRVSMPAEHPLAKVMADSKRRAARRRAFESASELADEDEATIGPRPTAPMPASFLPPFTPLPFTPPALNAAPARPFLGQGHTEPLPMLSSGQPPPSPALAANGAAVVRNGATHGHPGVVLEQVPTTSSPWAVPVSESMRASSGCVPVAVVRRTAIELAGPGATDDSPANSRSQVMPPPPAMQPLSTPSSSGYPRSAPAPAASSRGAVAVRGHQLSAPVPVQQPAPAPPTPPAAPVGLRPAPVATSPGRAPARPQLGPGSVRPLPAEGTVEAQRMLPAYVVGSAAGLGLALAGALAILLLVRAPGAGEAAEQPSATSIATSGTIPASAPGEASAAPALPTEAPTEASAVPAPAASVPTEASAAPAPPASAPADASATPVAAAPALSATASATAAPRTMARASTAAPPSGAASSRRRVLPRPTTLAAAPPPTGTAPPAHRYLIPADDDAPASVRK